MISDMFTLLYVVEEIFRFKEDSYEVQKNIIIRILNN